MDHSVQRSKKNWLGQIFKHPALVILLLAPFFGETLSGATPPFDLILPWNLALMAGLYGCGALICREVAQRFKFSLLELCLLGAAYGVFEEALVDKYWFYPQFWHDTSVGTYSVVWGTNLLLATHLTIFHTAVSIVASILIVERLFPEYRQRPWVGNRGLALAGLTLGVLVPFVYGEFSRIPQAAVFIAAAALCALLVASAFMVPQLNQRLAGKGQPRLSQRWLGVIAFIGTAAHFGLTYGIPSTGVTWPAGIAISLLPIVIAIFLIRRIATDGPYGNAGLKVVTGILTFFIILDIIISLCGRYDLILTSLALAFGLYQLNKQISRGSKQSDP